MLVTLVDSVVVAVVVRVDVSVDGRVVSVVVCDEVAVVKSHSR